MKKTLAFVFVLVFLASNSWAVLINEWDYTLKGIFTDYIGSSVVALDDQTLSWAFEGGVFSPGMATDATKLEWGQATANGGWVKSSISVENKSGSIFTNGPQEDGLKLSHDNRPITGNGYLSEGTLRATLELTPIDPNLGFSFPIFSTVLEFDFYETSNSLAEPGNWDVFILKNPEVTTENFAYNGYMYTFSFFGFDNIKDLFAELDETFVSPYAEDAVGWITEELKLTNVITKLQISATPVPEPTTAVLLGAGLLGLAVAGRRARKN
jgi:hypothetical protein